MAVTVIEVGDDRLGVESAGAWLGRLQGEVDGAASAGELDSEGLPRLTKTMREAALRVSAEVVPDLDAATANQVNERLISILSLDPDENDPPAAADRYLLDLEAVRHILREQLSEQRPEAQRRDAGAVIATLEAWLPSVGGAQLAELLGQSVRQVQRRRLADAPASSREQLVARLVAVLRHAWTDAGVVAWFHRARPDLAGASPLELLDDPDRERELLIAARSGRVQGGG